MNTSVWRDYNWVLAFALVGLSVFSITMVYSATLNDPMTLGYFNRHLVNVLIGLAVMVAVTFLDYHAFQSWTFPLYVLSIILLATVLIYGNIRGGAQSWLDFGMRTVQPSEPIKLVIILVLAGFWASQERSLGTWRPFIGSALLLGVPLLLVFIQPDFGTALVFASVWLTITWIAGITIPQIITLIGVGTPLFYFG
jgi:rod shape determining protein RodA